MSARCCTIPDIVTEVRDPETAKDIHELLERMLAFTSDNTVITSRATYPSEGQHDFEGINDSIYCDRCGLPEANWRHRLDG